MNLEEITEGLTPAQESAVKTVDKDLEIVACAGAGKTKTITRRIIYLIANGVAPENIVAITFTKKAAAEMEERIYRFGEKILGNTVGFAGMFIGTIDAFCLKMLQDQKEEYAKFSVLDEIQTKIFLQRYEKKEQSGIRESLVDRAGNLNDFWRSNTEKFGKKISVYTGLMAILNSSWYDRRYRNKWDEETLSCLNAYNQCLRDNKYFDFSGFINFFWASSQYSWAACFIFVTPTFRYPSSAVLRAFAFSLTLPLVNVSFISSTETEL